MDFKQEITVLLAQHTKLPLEEVEMLVGTPPSSDMGDYAFPCFKLGKNPHQAAEQLKQNIPLPVFVEKIEVAGPYLNFFLNKPMVAEETLKSIYQQAKHYGATDVGKSKKLVIDFSSPNIAKPFGIGHLRSTVIGNSLVKIFSFLNYKVIGVNHLGDWGTQFGKLIVAYRKWGVKEKLQKEPIKHLLHLYVKFHEEAEKNDDFNELARAEFKKLEDGDKDALALWEAFRELSLQEFQKMYTLLQVSFDSYQGEAFYNTLLNSTVSEMEANRKVPTRISEGALIVDLEKYGLAPVLLRKSNGSTTYHTRDIAAALYRVKKYKPEKILYVVGMEQKLHFQQLFKVLELAGLPAEKFVHVDFGLFRFPEGKMSTRKGNVIFLEEVLDKAIAHVAEIIREKNPTLPDKQGVARAVGVGAIIFADLNSDRTRNIDFDWDRMLSFDGETGPYLQYTHARICSILRKSDIQPSLHVSYAALNTPEEARIISLLSAFPSVVLLTAHHYKPHHVAQYLLSLAQVFNEFYHKHKVISPDKEVSKARILLVDSVRQVLRNGLFLLGLQAVERM